MPYVGFDPKSGCRNCLVASIAAMYVADIGLTGAFAMFSFHGLLVGKTWQPPTMVRGPVGVVGFVDVVRVAGIGLDRAMACAVAAARDDADGAGDPGRCGRALRMTPPAGVGTAWPDGPLQAVTTIVEHTRAMPSRRLVASARKRITAVASPGQPDRS
jgi:hypothetical protein